MNALADGVADRSAETLIAADLEALARGDTLALRIAGFYDAHSCAVVQDRVMAAAKSRYAVAPDVTKIGMALFEATSEALLDDYYADARTAQDRARALYQGLDDPIDMLRRRLDALWPAGCEIERLHGAAMYAGLVRVIDRDSELRPHQDNTDWDMPGSERAQTMRAQFSANVYFSAAAEGGALELWPLAIREEPAYRAAQVPGDYALRRDVIGAPAMRLRPCAGDLIIFNARCIHAVERVRSGTRTNASTFIGLRDPETPLTLFS